MKEGTNHCGLSLHDKLHDHFREQKMRACNNAFLLIFKGKFLKEVFKGKNKEYNAITNL